MPKVEPNNAGLGLERLVFFTDAVMAIAMTLLAVDLKAPDVAQSLAAAELPARLNDMAPRFMSFVVSFVVVAIYWMSHHRYFGFIRRYDNRLILMNTVFLFFIVCMPFVASLLGEYGNLPLGVATYAATVAAIGFTKSAIWWYASHNHRLIDKDLGTQYIHMRNTIALWVPVIFLVSIPVALFDPVLGRSIWWIAPLITLVIQRVAMRQKTGLQVRGNQSKVV